METDQFIVIVARYPGYQGYWSPLDRYGVMDWYGSLRPAKADLHLSVLVYCLLSQLEKYIMGNSGVTDARSVVGSTNSSFGIDNNCL